MLNVRSFAFAQMYCGYISMSFSPVMPAAF
jgi:hypothetical protein